MTEKQYVLKEVQNIISDIESELNAISKPAKKQIANTVYFLGTNLTRDTTVGYGIKENKVYSFIIKKSFWKNKMTLELRSSKSVGPYSFDDYRSYNATESLEFFDIESLVVIKHFLLSFAS